MYRDEDILMRGIRRLFDLVAAVVRREAVSDAEVDRATRDAIGLDLRTIDALPTGTLVGLLAGTDDLAVARRKAAARLLETLADGVLADAPTVQVAQARRDKAEALRDSVS